MTIICEEALVTLAMVRPKVIQYAKRYALFDPNDFDNKQLATIWRTIESMEKKKSPTIEQLINSYGWLANTYGLEERIEDYAMDIIRSKTSEL